MRFVNRSQAGQALALRLLKYQDKTNTLILGLPRGGVPVGFQMANLLHLPLDILIVRKLGVPGFEELAFGAIASGDVLMLNQEIVQSLNISEMTIQHIVAKERQELERRETLYRGDKPFPSLTDQTIILVDDGLATGASMRAAIRAVRQKKPSTIIVAVPVGALSTCNELQQEADEVICALTPLHFESVGSWYEDFSQTTDEEVRALLKTS
ncbi:MAG: phosphoribosyltransferase [Verrucomicrobiae bacterium]|nr:phosphoribosyltransferase [Verrucomicrobiae bacterium]